MCDAVSRSRGRLDLRLVPAALTSWAVTAAGILWSVGGVIAVLLAAIGRHRRGGLVGQWPPRATDVVRDDGAGVVAVALVGVGFAIAVWLRVDDVRHHPITDRYGSVATVVVTPSESPRSLGGGRMMFRGSLQVVDGSEMSGRVVVFASVLGFAELTAGQPAELPRPHHPADPARSHRRGAVGDR